MATVETTTRSEGDDGFTFDVVVTDGGTQSHHLVHLSRRDYDLWAGGRTDAASVAGRSVELLIELVSQDDLKDEFDLREALQRYPAVDEEVRRRLV